MHFLLACVYNWLSVRKAAEVQRLDSELEKVCWSLEEDDGGGVELVHGHAGQQLWRVKGGDGSIWSSNANWECVSGVWREEREGLWCAWHRATGAPLQCVALTLWWRLCAETIQGINGGRGFFVWKVKQTHKCLKPALFLMATRGWYQRSQVLYKSIRKQLPAWTCINTNSVTYFGSYWLKRSAL